MRLRIVSFVIVTSPSPIGVVAAGGHQRQDGLGLDFLHPFTMVGGGLWSVAFPAGAVLCALVLRRSATGAVAPSPISPSVGAGAGR